MRSRRFSRTASVTFAAVAAVLALTQWPSPQPLAAPQLERELVIVATGGVFEQALKEHFYEPFSKATGVAVRSVAASSREQWARAKAMSTAGQVEWDIVSLGSADHISQREILRDLGDCRGVPSVAQHGVSGTCLRYGILRTVGGGVIAYNTSRLPAGKRPRGWADFWNVRDFPGPRALYNAGSPWWNLMAALVADGVPPDKLFPLDLDRAFRKLDEIKPHVKVWWRTGDQSQQIIRDGEVAMAMMWSGRALSLKAAGVPVDIEWNQAIKDVASWGILREAPHPQAALAFLNFFMERPEAHLAFARQVVYDTPNRRALDLLSSTERYTRATYEPNWQSMLDTDLDWVASNRDHILERWNAWLAQ